MATKLPYMISDVEATMSGLANAPTNKDGWAVMNPFYDVYRLIFRLSNRALGAFEIAEDDKLLDEVLNVFRQFEHYENPTRIIAPWIPTMDHFWRGYYALQLYLRLLSVIKKRKKSGVVIPDTMQYLLDQNYSMQELVMVCLIQLCTSSRTS